MKAALADAAVVGEPMTATLELMAVSDIGTDERSGVFFILSTFSANKTVSFPVLPERKNDKVETAPQKVLEDVARLNSGGPAKPPRCSLIPTAPKPSRSPWPRPSGRVC